MALLYMTLVKGGVGGWGEGGEGGERGGEGGVEGEGEERRGGGWGEGEIIYFWKGKDGTVNKIKFICVKM